MVAAKTQLRSFKKFVLLSEGKDFAEDTGIAWPNNFFEEFFYRLKLYDTGDWDEEYLTVMFSWVEEPEGHSYWGDIAQGGPMPLKADFKLRSWKARAIAEGLI